MTKIAQWKNCIRSSRQYAQEVNWLSPHKKVRRKCFAKVRPLSAAWLIMSSQNYEMISQMISYYILGQMILRKRQVKFQNLLQN